MSSSSSTAAAAAATATVTRQGQAGAAFRDTKGQSSQLWNTISSLLTIVAGAALAVFVRVDEAVVRDMHSLWFIASIASIASFFSIFIYLELYLAPTRGRKIDYKNWERDIPKSIQYATFFGIIGTASSNVYLWPSYGILTPILLLVWFMALTSLLSFLGKSAVSRSKNAFKEL